MARSFVCLTTKLSDHWPTVTPGGKENMEQPECNDAAERASGSLERMVSRPREITPDDVTKEADRNYELGRKHGHSEKADLLDWAESLLCNAVPMSHCTQEDWDAAVKKWRDEKHGVAKSANDQAER